MEKLKKLWQNLGKSDRRKFVAELSIACHVSPYTVSGWINSGHEPHEFMKEKIVEYVRENYDEKFEL